MKDELPEINFKEKREKKGGLIGWLRGRGGFFPRGGMGGSGLDASVLNLGRAAGQGGFGASSAGVSGLLSGNVGTVLTVALCGAAALIYVADNAPMATPSAVVFSSSNASSDYVPAILRSQAANNNRSSLDILREANKDYSAAGEAGASGAAVPADGDTAAPAQQAAAQAEFPAADQTADPAQGMMAQLQSGGISTLTSSLGGGSNKFSGMGGFSSKFGQGQIGGKPGFSTGIGAGFSGMPKFGERKGKLLAMKGSSRPVFSGAKAGKPGKTAPGAFGQARGLRAIQKSYTGASIDAMRSTQDKAWEGSTGEGETAGGAGLSDGGAGVVTSPSLDNASSGGGAGAQDEVLPPEAALPINVSPWAGLLAKAMMLIMLSAVLSAVGGMLITKGKALMSNPVTASLGIALYIAGIMLCVAALIMAVMAIMIGIQIMTAFGQALLGSVYLLGGGVAMAAAVMAMTGASVGAITPLWMSAIAGVIALMASMFAM